MTRDPKLESRLLADALSGRITRRDVLKYSAGLGLSASFVSTLLAACGGGGDDDDDTDTDAGGAEGDEPTATTAEDTGDAGEATEPAAEGEATSAPSSGESEPAGDVPRNRTLICMQGGNNGQNPDFQNFNLFVTGANDGWHTGPVQCMSEPLIMFTVLTGEYENWLAEDWEYNDDFTEITMTLREGITWSDGEPFTADDVAFTYNIIRDNQDSAVNAAEIQFLEEAIVDDERTVRFVLNEANPRWWATTLTSNHGVTEQIFPRHIVEEHADNILEFNFYDPEQGWPVTTGPYRLVSTSPEQKIFDRRDDWWAVETGFKELPQVERVIYIPNSEETLASQRLINNEVDISRILSVPTLQASFGQNPRITTFSGQEAPFGYLDWCPIDLNFNCAVAPWDNPDMRWAVNFAVNREELVNLAEAGAGVVAYHQFTPYEWFEDPFNQALQPLLEEFGLDAQDHPDQVEELMTGMGYEMNGDGMWADSEGSTVQMSIFVPEWLRAYGPPLSQQLRDAGFDAEFDNSPGLQSQVLTGEQALGFGCKGPSGVRGMDPYFMLSTYTSQYFRPVGQPAPTGWATSRWQNEEYDEVVSQMETLAVDDPQTLELFTQAMRIWLRELPDLYTSQLIIRYPWTTEYWTGWPNQDDVYGFPHTWQQEFMKTIVRLQPTQ